MEPEGSSPYPQEPATCPYPDPDQAVHALLSYFSKIHFNIINPPYKQVFQVVSFLHIPQQKNPVCIPVKENDK